MILKIMTNMRKQLLLVLLALMPMMVSAEVVEIDGLWYNIDNSANTAKVIQYKKNNQKYSGDIVIPDVVTYNNIEYNVTSIGERAFLYCIGLTSITIPNSVTSIGKSAFNGCSSLTSITIGNSIKDINASAFANCPELTDVLCYAEAVPWTESNAFDGSNIDHATLHVPEVAFDSYRTTEPGLFLR